MVRIQSARDLYGLTLCEVMMLLLVRHCCRHGLESGSLDGSLGVRIAVINFTVSPELIPFHSDTSATLENIGGCCMNQRPAERF